MAAATSSVLGLMLGSERLHMPKENWRSHAVGAVRFMGRKEKSCSTCRLACKCLSHFGIQKSKLSLLSFIKVALPLALLLCQARWDLGMCTVVSGGALNRLSGRLYVDRNKKQQRARVQEITRLAPRASGSGIA